MHDINHTRRVCLTDMTDQSSDPAAPTRETGGHGLPMETEGMQLISPGETSLDQVVNSNYGNADLDR